MKKKQVMELIPSSRLPQAIKFYPRLVSSTGLPRKSYVSTLKLNAEHASEATDMTRRPTRTALPLQ
jgi:hypothetical protein